jgi:hypothetical protein
LFIGLKNELLIKEVCVKGNVNKINKDEAKAKTPINLSGILLKIA